VTGVVPEPRPASTVVLLRDRDGDLEVFMMERVLTMPFAPGMHVFPGGRLDPPDFVAGADLPDPSGIFARDARRASSDEAEYRALVACALRELVEESGVTVPLADIHLADHWITPEVEGRRFDTRFFVAPMPEEQQAVLTGTEAQSVCWVRPAHALDEHEAGRMPLLRPTSRVLEYLGGFADSASVIGAVQERLIRPMLPRRMVADDGTVAWAMVNGRTGDLIEGDVEPPRFWELTGAR
jgi:8-oxo-dGTP pyrophosphatase MutT (NUDIX family)